MAVAASALAWTSAGSETSTTGTLTFSGTYTTGGESILPAKLGLGTITMVDFIQAEDGYVFKWDKANNKVLIYTSAGFTPAGTIAKPTFTVTKGAILASSELGLSADATSATVNNNTIASTLTLLAANSPVNAPAFTGTAVAAGALAQLANAASLTGIVVQFKAWGV